MNCPTQNVRPKIRTISYEVSRGAGTRSGKRIKKYYYFYANCTLGTDYFVKRKQFHSNNRSSKILKVLVLPLDKFNCARRSLYETQLVLLTVTVL